MEKFKLLRNIIIVLVGLFIAFFLLGQVKRDVAEAPEVIPPVSEEPAAELKLTSLKGVEIFITMPADGEAITSPLVIRGRAPGNWFFEANAGLTLTDWDGLIIAESYIMAEGEWMTTEYVPFSGTLNFTKPAYGERGTIILKKDNPSGEPQFDDAAEMTIKFK